MEELNNQFVNIHELLERFKSKKEFYRFLQMDCKAYLPKIGSVNIYFFKQILQAKKEIQIVLEERLSKGLFNSTYRRFNSARFSQLCKKERTHFEIPS